MSLKRFDARRDQTEPAILRAYRQVGADYLLLDSFDALILFRGKLFMVDCKSPRGRVTAAQDRLVKRGWPLQFVRNVDEALKVIGLTTEKDLARRDKQADAPDDPPHRPIGDESAGST